MACGLYCFTLGLTGSWTLGHSGFQIRDVWLLMVCLAAASALAGTVALMFSTFLNPFFAAGGTAVVLLLPAVLERTVNRNLGIIVPAWELTATVVKSSFDSPVQISWTPILLALIETVLFWLMSAWIFKRVDIAVAVE